MFNKIHLIAYSTLTLLLIVLSGFCYYYKIDNKEKEKTISILNIDLENTKLNLEKANSNINQANINLEQYIQLNNKLNKQLKKLNSIKISDDVNIEVKQINCLFNNIAKKGDCINGEFIKE